MAKVTRILDINKDGRADVRITGIAPSNQNRTRIIRGPGGLFKGRMVAKNGGDPTRTLLVKSATKLPGANYIKKREDKKTLNEFLGKRVNLIGGRVGVKKHPRSGIMVRRHSRMVRRR